MKRFLWWAWALDLVCTAGVGAFLPVAIHLRDQSTQVSLLAAHSNLNTALVGAQAYYLNSNNSFKGLGAVPSCPYSCPSGEPDYVVRRPSTGPWVISVAVRPDGQHVVMVAFAKQAATCVGVVAIAAQPTFRPELGQGRVDYFQISPSSARACNAASLRSPPVSTRTSRPQRASI